MRSCLTESCARAHRLSYLASLSLASVRHRLSSPLTQISMQIEIVLVCADTYSIEIVSVCADTT